MAEHFNHYFAFVFTRDKSLASTISGGSMTKIHNYLSEGGNTCSELTLDISIVSKAISRLRAISQWAQMVWLRNYLSKHRN